MRDQEEHSEWKGGMLADEMGGFILVFISLHTLTVRPTRHGEDDPNACIACERSPQAEPGRGADGRNHSMEE